MRRLLLASAASLLISSQVFAATIPLVSGPTSNEPSQENATINAVINNVIFGTYGLIGSAAGPVTSVSTTTALNFVSTSIPTSQINTSGQAIRVHCWGRTAANTDNKTLNVTLGAAKISTPLVSTSGVSWDITLLSQIASATLAGNIGIAWAGSSHAAADANNIFFTMTSTPDATTVWSGAVTAACGYLQGSSSQDATMDGFTIEQLK